jgi:excisionase family DNA binding protein
MPLTVESTSPTAGIARTSTTKAVNTTKLINFHPPARGFDTDCTTEDKLLTYRATAQVLRVSESYLRAKGKQLIPAIKLGSRVRFKLSDVLAYIEKNKL